MKLHLMLVKYGILCLEESMAIFPSDFPPIFYTPSFLSWESELPTLSFPSPHLRLFSAI